MHLPTVQLPMSASCGRNGKVRRFLLLTLSTFCDHTSSPSIRLVVNAAFSATTAFAAAAMSKDMNKVAVAILPLPKITDGSRV